MTQDQVVSLVVDAMTVSLKLALPVLLVALVVGLAVSIFQAVTQIQEQTLTFIPKLFVMSAVFVLTMFWMMRGLVEFTVQMLRALPGLGN